MSSSSSATYSRHSSRSSSRSATPRSNSVSNGPNNFLNYLYQPKTFNLLLSLCILFFIVILSFVLFNDDVRKTVTSPICNCEENFYYNYTKCAKHPDLQDEMVKPIIYQIKREIVNCATIQDLEKIIIESNPQIKSVIEYLPAFIYRAGYYVDSEGLIHSCKYKESCLGYEVTIVILFIVCFILTAISFSGKSK